MSRSVVPWYLVALCAVGAAAPTCAGVQQPGPESLAAGSQEILRKYCFDCHGKDPRKPKGDLKVLDHAQLLDGQRELVVPGSPGKSELLRQIEQGKMPPGARTKVSAAELKVLQAWARAGAPAFPEPLGPAADAKALASRVKEIFRSHCLECHGGSKTNGGIKILDHDLLVARKKKVVPGRPDDSELLQLLSAQDETVMPPAGQLRLNADEIETVRRWIVVGAPPFSADVPALPEKNKDPTFKDVAGVDYVLKKILADVQKVPREDRPFIRYFSIAHLINRGVTAEEVDLHRDALAKAINHLSWEPKIVGLRSIDDPVAALFAVDLRELGWHRRPYERIRGGKVVGRSSLTLFDLALVEYPYAIFYEDSDTFDNLVRDFLVPAGQVRPIPYLRADWFVSVCTQSPIYEDFLQLPFDLKELETRLGVNVNLARRAGMAVSAVSRSNRVVERYPARHGAFWRSYDFRSSKGQDNIFIDPMNLQAAGGEYIFHLPNGLQCYMIANSKGVRVDLAPTEIVTDKFAEDKTVRNGLACMRCHNAGMKGFADAVRPALERLPGRPGFDKQQALRLYPPQAEMDALLREDSDRFTAALRKALGKYQVREPLAPVSLRFLDAPLQLASASAELGLPGAAGLQEVFKTGAFPGLGLAPLTSEGVVRRDMWEDHYDQVVRQLRLGVPFVPLDGMTRPDHQPGVPWTVELSTNKRGNVFEPSERAVIRVTNKSDRDLYIELIGTSARGEKLLLTPGVVSVRAGKQYVHPPEGSLEIQPLPGKDLVTLYASDKPFPAGELLRGKGVTDRVVHPFYRPRTKDQRISIGDDADRIVKKTLEVETR